MYEALVRLDDRGNFAPSLAASWTLADDAQTWTFKLRQNVRCHNGDLLKSQDTVESIKRACDPTLGGDLGTEGLYYSYLKDMTLEALDDQTVQMVTATPMADLLDLIVDIPIIPQGALTGLPQTPVGSGPYRLVEEGSNLVVMEAFDQYWDGTPPVRRIFWRAEPDAGRRVDMLLAGEVDLITQVPLDQRRAIEENTVVDLVIAPSSVCAVFMCNAQAGVCADRRVRQALNYALDMSAIIDEVMAGTAEPLNGPLTLLHFGSDPDTPPYPYDPEKARELLADAGYGDGMRLVLNVPTVLPDEATHLAGLMADYYAKVGVDTEIKEFSDRPGYADRVKAKQIDDACCFDSSPLSTFRPLREKFHSGIRGPWWQGYVNGEIDKLLDQAQATTDSAERQQVYRRAYRIIRDDAPWIFFYSPTLAWGIGPRARGWKPTIDGLVKLA
jgi:peptide/nickel transport system substrate-binding protein